MAWPVPHACAQPYHPDSDSHGQLVCPYWGSSAWHSRRVSERGKSPCIKDPLLSRWVQSTPVSASSTQHMWKLLAGNRTALLPRHARGRRIRSYPDVCASCRIRETEDWEEFNISWQLYTVLYRETIIFVQHFCGNIRIFVATTCFVLPLSTLCCLLESSKCLWHWRWRRSESFALKAFRNLNGVI